MMKKTDKSCQSENHNGNLKGFYRKSYKLLVT